VQDTDLKLRYVLAAEADTYLAANNVTQFGYVTAVDAVEQQVFSPCVVQLFRRRQIAITIGQLWGVFCMHL